MKVIFEHDALARMDSERGFTGGFIPPVVSAYRGRLQLIRAASDEGSMQQLKLLRMQQARAAHQCSLRVTDDWDLLVAFARDGDGKRIAVVKAMVQITRTNPENL